MRKHTLALHSFLLGDSCSTDFLPELKQAMFTALSDINIEMRPMVFTSFAERFPCCIELESDYLNIVK